MTKPPPVEAFELEDCHGLVDPRFRPLDLAAAVGRLSDPAAATETVHWGRNYLYRSRLETGEASLDVVVKQYRNQGWVKRLRRRWRGSKAARCFHNARAFQAAGLPTADAVLLIESKRSDGQSLFVSRDLKGLIEARYLLRAANQGREKELFPGVDMEAFLDALGHTLRRMHQAGIFHRDLSIGNVLLPETLDAMSGSNAAVGANVAGGANGLYLIDLGRARRKRRLSLSQRTRDLCRLAIFRPEHQRRFLDAYWGAGGASGVRAGIYKLYHHGFHWRMEAKNKVREWRQRYWKPQAPRHPHAHIPAAAADASARDKSVWDHLSDQPHQHAGRFEKLGVRIRDAPSHLRQMATLAVALPRIVRRYRRLSREIGGRPIDWGGVGVGVRPYPEAPDRQLAAIDDLGVDKVLLRLHPWDDDHGDEEALARELAGRGLDLTFALPQNRDLVRDPARWRMKVEELAERFGDFGRRFQIGQAINRSKWGIWRYGEYLDLAASAAEILKRRPGVEILGPAVIDFEFHVTASVLNLRQDDVDFDILSSLLYVDRRGAPERAQLGFDTVAKVILLKAIAETARHCGPRSWITEVNWPLSEGPHSPAGRAVAVSPQEQADYLVRYYLLTLTSGAVERVYWWQLVARGYGLLVPDGSDERADLNRRPAFAALATLAAELRGSRFLRRLPSPRGTWLLLFRHRDGGDCVAGWSIAGSPRVTLPATPREVVEQHGGLTQTPADPRVKLSPSVHYFRI